MDKQFFETLAKALGSGPWTVTRWEPHYATLTASDGKTLYINSTHYTNKFHISVGWPSDSTGKQHSYLGYKVESPSINVGITKPAAQVAKDIERRLFPDYLPLFEKQLHSAKATDISLQLRNEAMQKIARETGGTFVPADSRTGLAWVKFPHRNEGGVVNSIKVYDHHVDLDLHSVPRDKAIEIIRLLYQENS